MRQDKYIVYTHTHARGGIRSSLEYNFFLCLSFVFLWCQCAFSFFFLFGGLGMEGIREPYSDGNPVWDRKGLFVKSNTAVASAVAELLPWPFGPYATG